MAYTGDIILSTFEVNGKPYEEVKVACKRCGGSGEYSYNEKDGTRCYGCDGSGYNKIKRRILTEKEKSQRERAKLKREEKAKKEAEEKAEIYKVNYNKNYLKKQGFEENESIFIVVEENSFDIREELKGNGARWHGLLKHWYFIKNSNEYKVVELEKKNIFTVDTHGNYELDILKAHEVIQGDNASNYVDVEIGEKIEKEVTVISISGYYMQVTYKRVYTDIITLKDIDNNLIVWKTQSDPDIKEGDKLKIRATIKDFEEYNYKKQTLVKNVKILEKMGE